MDGVDSEKFMTQQLVLKMSSVSGSIFVER